MKLTSYGTGCHNLVTNRQGRLEGPMQNIIHSALANAARFRADNGDIARAEQLLQKSIEIADFGGSNDDKFFSRIHQAQFLCDAERDVEAEAAYKKAIDVVPLAQFSLRHALAIKELSEVVTRLGRAEEGQALEVLASTVFDSLAGDICNETVRASMDLAS